jgi:hypothetical protein
MQIQGDSFQIPERTPALRNPECVRLHLREQQTGDPSKVPVRSRCS